MQMIYKDMVDTLNATAFIKPIPGIDISSCDVTTVTLKPATENYPRCIFVRFAELEMRNRVSCRLLL